LIKPVLSGMWAVAGMDAMLLGLALLAAWTARRLTRKADQARTMQSGQAARESLP
jgi:hypothetical protein